MASNVSCTTIVYTLYNKTDMQMIFIYFFFVKVKKKMYNYCENHFHIGFVEQSVYNCCAGNVTHLGRLTCRKTN
jgi:hypothetical protein